MIAYLKGKVLAIQEETAIISVGGLGYEVYCTASAFSKMSIGFETEIFTYLQMKEDGMTLFGFSSTNEKEVFLKLIAVQGVGPKLGISVLTSLSADQLATAIATADVKRLSSVKGLGKKTAEKIILELHGKISAAEIMSVSETPATQKASAEKLSPEDEDAVAALMGLGFTKNESVQAVKRAREKGAKSVEEIIMRALQGI